MHCALRACVVQPAGVRRRCVGERKCSGRACCCAGVGEGLRRGMSCEGQRGMHCALRACIAQPAGVRRRCVGERKCSARACRCAGASEGLRREWIVGSAGLTHIRRSSTRARVLLYIRPPCPRREIAAMGPKDAPASTHRPRRLSHSPRPRLHFLARVHTFPAWPSVPPTKNSPFRRMTSAPAPSAFTLPPHRLPRPPRSNRPPAAAVIHNGLSTEKLSTSLLAALCKTFSPSRLRTRIYNISFARRPLPGSVHAVVPPCPAPPCAGWGRAKAKADAPSRSAEPCRLCAESLCAKAEVHKANPAPVRALSPRQPAYGRAPARLCAESLCAKAEVHQANPAPARAFSPRQLVYGRAPAR